MNRWALLLLAACVVVTACDDNDTPTSPSNQPLVFTALLFPNNEVPLVTNAEASGQGAVQVTFNVTRDASNAITGGTALFYWQLHGFPGDTRVIAAHIHNGPAGVAAPVILDTGIALSPTTLTGGIGEFRTGPVNVSGDLAQQIANNPAGFYFNVHSPANPGGFARGQLRRIQ